MRDRRLYPIMPSVKALTNPVSSTIRIMYEILRSMALIFASICGLISRPIKRVSSANTSIFHHDGRVMATNEVGPPMRVFLPLLKTVGWFTGNMAEGEPVGTDACKEGFGSPGMEGAMKEMTTAHVSSPKGEIHNCHCYVATSQC